MDYPMDSVIAKLTEIENAASGILKGAANAEERLDQEQTRRIRDFDKTMEENTQAEITALQKQLSEKSQEELSHVQEISRQDLEALDRMYTTKHNQLAEEIYQRIIRK